MTTPSKELQQMMNDFETSWLPQSGEIIGMPEREFRDEFQPELFKESLDDIVKKAIGEGQAGGKGG